MSWLFNSNFSNVPASVGCHFSERVRSAYCLASGHLGVLGKSATEHPARGAVGKLKVGEAGGQAALRVSGADCEALVKFSQCRGQRSTPPRTSPDMV